MFHSARIKLTAWYLLIIMIVSLAFSAFIFRSVTIEFQRRLNEIERRFSNNLPVGWRVHGSVHEYFLEDYQIARLRVLLFLLYANGTLFVISAALGYYLAGKTLSPIEVAMNEQKRFVADASHELRTPLTAMKTSLEVALRDKNMDLSEAKKVIRESVEDVDSLTGLTGNLLTLANYQSGKNGVNYNNFVLNDVIDKVIDKMMPLMKKKKINLTTNVQKNINLMADETDIEKLITILIDNAIKYSHAKGGIVITSNKKGKSVNLSVKDTGIGIREDDIPFIFDRFFRADNSRSKVHIDGYGLGLSVAKEIVDRHSGKIKVESKIDQGSVFSVTIPQG